MKVVMCFLHLSHIFMLMVHAPPWYPLDDVDNELVIQTMYDNACLTHIPALPPPRSSFYQMMAMTGHNRVYSQRCT